MSAKSILLVDDDCDALLVLGKRFRSMGLHVQTAHNLVTALSVVERRIPDLVCIDVRMPTGNGLRFCEMLANGSDTEQIPIIVLTGERDAETVRTCEQIKAHCVPKRPDMWIELRPLVERLLNQPGADACEPHQRSPVADDGLRLARPDEKSTRAARRAAAASSRIIVIAHEEADVVDLLTERFTELGWLVIGVDKAMQAINVIDSTLPDLACIDINMQAGNGLSVCEMMARDQRLRGIPTIALAGEADEDATGRCHDTMVHYVGKGGDIWGQVESLLRELLRLEGQGEPADQQADMPPAQPISVAAASADS